MRPRGKVTWMLIRESSSGAGRRLAMGSLGVGLGGDWEPTDGLPAVAGQRGLLRFSVWLRLQSSLA